MGTFIEYVVRCDKILRVCVRERGHEWMKRYTSHLVKLFKYRIKYLASVIFYGRFVLYATTRISHHAIPCYM